MNDHEKITTTTVWMTNFTLLVWLENRQKIWLKKNRRKKNRNRKNNMTKVIVYYNVRKMCEKNPFVIKDTHLLLNMQFVDYVQSYFEQTFDLRGCWLSTEKYTQAKNAWFCVINSRPNPFMIVSFSNVANNFKRSLSFTAKSFLFINKKYNKRYSILFIR